MTASMFPIEDNGDADDEFNVGALSEAEAAFVAALRDNSGDPEHLAKASFLTRTADGGSPLVAAVYVDRYTGCVAVHFFGQAIRCGWVHNQLFYLVDDASNVV